MPTTRLQLFESAHFHVFPAFWERPPRVRERDGKRKVTDFYRNRSNNAIKHKPHQIQTKRVDDFYPL